MTDTSFTVAEAAAVLDLEPESLQSWDKRGVLPVPDRPAGTWRRFSAEELALLSLQVQLVNLGIPPGLSCQFARELESAVLGWDEAKNFAVVALYGDGFKVTATNDLSTVFRRRGRRPKSGIVVDLEACIQQVIDGVRKLVGDPLATVNVVRKHDSDSKSRTVSPARTASARRRDRS